MFIYIVYKYVFERSIIERELRSMNIYSSNQALFCKKANQKATSVTPTLAPRAHA